MNPPDIKISLFPDILSLYIHIPFCKQKCSYCDFVSYAGKENLIDEYVEVLAKGIKTLTPLPPLPEVKGGKTIYFGGGTPTLLKPKHFELLLSRIAYHVSGFEVSVESNPGTVDKTYLCELRKLGVNRLSIGAQSFNDKHLKTLGRIHDSRRIYQAYEDARAAGFDNINLDLIFAIPNQTLDEWKDDLKRAVSLGPEHLSTYNLQIEEGTPLWEMTKLQAPNPKQSSIPKLQLPNEELDADMYEHTINALTANGYRHYEISNFAKPGFECKHNINYWQNGNYIGLGAGAHSHLDGKRWANTNGVEDYISTTDDGRKTHDETGSITDNRETLFMGLRLIDGIPGETFKGFEDKVQALEKDGLLKGENGNIRLTRKGLLLGNLVFEEFV